ncbi:MAG: DEAD/DEAH box helicase [Candidatus Yanofskybacteria bacterium]|nr:DEAD/DEAH box helicase [Candidatus Yanofskybacteria bacterium]
MYKRFSGPSRQGSPSGPHGRSNQARGRFSSYNRSSPKRLAPKRGLNISAFINKAVETKEEAQSFRPEHSFADFALHPILSRAITARGYDQPTPIQDKIIPRILQGLDVVGLANTGTGKTAAFLIPLINKALANRQEQVLILAPTRELALQIEQEFLSFAKAASLYSVVCVGGASMGLQIRKLRLHNHFIIGTPGRILDLMRRNVLVLDKVRAVVLDEADRMLDMGFINDIRFVLNHVPEKRHMLCFSATMSPSIRALVNDFLSSPVVISVKTQETPKSIDQDVVHVRGLNKIDALHELLSLEDCKKALIFGRTKHGVEKLCSQLLQRGIKADSIHSNKSQSQRERALQGFKANKVQALIATDIAARGLDIDGITHVINYELPATYEDYVHRIGRTGRGTQKGKALTFVE